MNTIQTPNKLVAVLMLLFILLWGGLVNPDSLNVTTCLFLEKTGHPCPTCGMSRSFYATFHLDLHEAFRFHILGPVLYLFLFIIVIILTIELASGRKIQWGLKMLTPKHLCYIFIFLLLLHWLYVLFFPIGN